MTWAGGAAGAVEVAESFAEDERVEKLKSLRAKAPIGIDGLIVGTLAGAPSADRPPVPVWEYLDYLATHPEVSLDELSQVRFPIAYYIGYTSVTSIAELLAPARAVATYELTPQDVVRLYQLQHEAGVLRWNAETLTHEEIRPSGTSRTAVYGRWRQELEAKA